MSLADFSQDAHDQARLFVYVTPLGETSGALFGAVIDSLQDLPPVQPRGSKDSFVSVRFLNHLPRWAKDGQPWQHFEPYKQVLGVLAVTQCHDKHDLDTAEDSFKDVCDHFKKTLCYSKCVVYGSKEKLCGAIQTRKDFTLVEFDNQQSFSKFDIKVTVSEHLQSVVGDFSESLFAKLQMRIAELKRELEAGKVKALRGPVEGKETDTEDDARLTRHQLSGRAHKHVADLHLLCGQLQSACTYFTQAITLLSPHAIKLQSRDLLWAGSANEGLGATFIMKGQQDDLLGQKSAALSVSSNLLGGFLKVSARITGPRLSLKAGHLEPRRRGSGPGGGGGEERGAMTNGRPTLYKRPKSPPGDARSDSLDSIEDDSMDVTDGSLLDISEEAAMEQDGEDEELEMGARKLLQKDLVVDRFTRAELNYKKAGVSGGVPRIELLFKFARYLVAQQRHKSATDVLQKIFWTESYIDEHDKTTLYASIAKVFSSMGYHRKAALFTQWSALQACNIASSADEFYKAHNLLSQCLPGYNLSLPTSTTATECVPSEPTGWPLLQAKVMKDFVYLTQKINENGMFIQYGCALLQKLHSHMSFSDLSSVAEHLNTIMMTQAQRSDATSPNQDPNEGPESLHHGLTRTPSADLKASLPLTEFPRVGCFRPKEFPPHLKPYRTKEAKTIRKGPFIVSQLGRGKKQRPELLWVIHDPAEIAMDVTNPLDFELRVEKMKVLSEGVSIVACPSSLSLPARDKQDFTLTALPQEVGELELIGYEHTVFGVHSTCNVKVEGNPLVKVIPMLPQLRLRVLPPFHAPKSQNSSESPSGETSPLKRGESHRSSVGPRVEIDMIDGENCRVEFKLECQKISSIESLSVGVESSTENHKPEDFCCFVCPTPDYINSLLPIASKEQRSFFVQINTKFPAYCRVKNDLMSNLSKRPSFGECGMYQPDVTQKQSFKIWGSPFRSLTSQRTKDGNSPPNSSPVSKRPLGKTEIGRHRGMMKQQQFVGPDSGAPSLVDSLNIDVPQASKVVLSSPASRHPALVHGLSPLRQKRGSLTLSGTGSPKSHWQDNEWDFNQFTHKRASIRSDPGDCKQGGSGLFNRSPRSSRVLTPVHKSPSVASRAGSLLDDPEYSTFTSGIEGAIFTFNDKSGSPRLSGSSTSPKSPAWNPLRKGVAGIKKGTISQPSDLRHNVHAILPKEVTVVGKFTLKYSGGEGGEAGYHRRMESSIRVKVRPSLYFEEFSIASVEGKQSSFSFSFYVHNKSGHPLTVTCSYKRSEEDIPQLYKATLSPKQKQRMEMILQRFNLPGSLALQTLHEVSTHPNMAKLYCNHLSKLVTVQWALEGVRRSGVSTLEGMRLPSSLLHLIQPLPLLIDVAVNDKSFAMDSESSEEYRVGTPVKISLTLTNNAGCPVPSSWLLVDLCELFGQCIIHDLTGRMIHSGNLLQRIPQLGEGESYEHKLAIVFFYKGDYQVKFIAYIPTKKGRVDALNGEEETDGGVEDSLTSPFLRGSSSPPPRGTQSELSGGLIFSPVKIIPQPLKSQLLPTSVELANDSHTPQERLISLAEVAKEWNQRDSSPCKLHLLDESPFPLKPTRSSNEMAKSGSIQARLSRLCERPVSGPILSLQIVESHISHHL